MLHMTDCFSAFLQHSGKWILSVALFSGATKLSSNEWNPYVLACIAIHVKSMGTAVYFMHLAMSSTNHTLHLYLPSPIKRFLGGTKGTPILCMFCILQVTSTVGS